MSHSPATILGKVAVCSGVGKESSEVNLAESGPELQAPHSNQLGVQLLLPFPRHRPTNAWLPLRPGLRGPGEEHRYRSSLNIYTNSSYVMPPGCCFMYIPYLPHLAGLCLSVPLCSHLYNGFIVLSQKAGKGTEPCLEGWAPFLVGVRCSVLCYVLSRFSHVQLSVTFWDVARQAPLSMGFSRQEYWSVLPCPSSGDLPNPRIELTCQ